MIGAAWLWLLRNPLSGVLGAASLAFFLAAGVQTVRLNASEARAAKQAAAYQADTLARQRAAIEAAEAFRTQEQHWQRQRAAAEATYAQALADRDRTIRELRRTADELRNAAARYAAGGGQPADDSVDACRARAATLAELFAEADAAAGELAAAADAHAGEVRLLRDAWPR